MKQILLSRTDSIGDVILTLPMAGVLKELHTEIKVHFLGKSYTKAIVSHSEYIDGFHNWDEIRDSNSYLSEIGFDAVIHVFPNSDIARVCKKSKIPLRVGTSHRVFHWWTCNKLLNFSRKNNPTY